MLASASATTDAVPSFLQQGYVSIGSTHNCCSCCWSLADYLSKKTELQIVLSGTHGIVRPWVAARGIPVDELRKLDLFLLDALHKRVAESIDSSADDNNDNDHDNEVKQPHRFHWLCTSIC